MPTLSECVFVWMRREFAGLLGVCEQDIRPDTPLARFLPSERRRAFWRLGQSRLGLRFPTLQLSAAMERTGNWLTIGSIARAVLYGLLIGPKWLTVPLVFLASIGSPILYHFFSLPWQTEHPDLETFGDLSQWLLARNMKKFRSKFGLVPDHDEIYSTIRAMLIETGVAPSAITPDASFSDLCDC
jgi:hypothetical protein